MSTSGLKNRIISQLIIFFLGNQLIFVYLIKSERNNYKTRSNKTKEDNYTKTKKKGKGKRQAGVERRKSNTMVLNSNAST